MPTTTVRLELGTRDGAFERSPNRVRACPQRARGRLVHDELARLDIAVRDPPLDNRYAEDAEVVPRYAAHQDLLNRVGRLRASGHHDEVDVPERRLVGDRDRAEVTVLKRIAQTDEEGFAPRAHRGWGNLGLNRDHLDVLDGEARIESGRVADRSRQQAGADQQHRRHRDLGHQQAAAPARPGGRRTEALGGERGEGVAGRLQRGRQARDDGRHAHEAQCKPEDQRIRGVMRQLHQVRRSNPVESVSRVPNPRPTMRRGAANARPRPSAPASVDSTAASMRS